MVPEEKTPVVENSVTLFELILIMMYKEEKTYPVKLLAKKFAFLESPKIFFFVQRPVSSFRSNAKEKVKLDRSGDMKN